MKRKINRVGTSTLTVSLPSKWAREHGLRPGDEVEVTEEGKSLIIGGVKGEAPKERYLLDLSNKKLLKRFLDVPYVLGYDEIKVNFKDEETLNDIKKTLEMMLGFELVEQGRDYCIIRNVVREMEDQFETMFQKLVYTIKTMSDEFYFVVKNNEFNQLKNVSSLRDIARKLNLFCGRILHKKTYLNLDKTIRFYHMGCLFEMISLDYKEICDYILKNKMKNNVTLLKYAKTINKYINEFTELFFKSDKKNQLIEFKKNSEQAVNEFLTEDRKYDKDELFILSKITHILDKLNQISYELV